MQKTTTMKATDLRMSVLRGLTGAHTMPIRPWSPALRVALMCRWVALANASVPALVVHLLACRTTAPGHPPTPQR